ncbi:MAG: ABC transporter substrate-binding protein [Pseudomonadota bacterium]
MMTFVRTKRLAKTVLTGAAFILALAPFSLPAWAEDRVVAIGSSVTEIVYALGQEGRLVARDSTSTFPAAVEKLPDVGYMRALAPEGVLSVNPTLILAEEGAGPPETLSVLENASVRFVEVPDKYTAEGIVNKIIAVGDALEVPEEAADLAGKVAADMAAAAKVVADKSDGPPRVMFVLSTAGGRVMAAGTNTAAEGIIALAGGKNVFEFEGYKPVTAEAVTASQPDIVLMMERAGSHSTDAQTLFAMPGFAPTPAAADARLVKLNPLLLLGFGPRTGEAVRYLADAFHGG